METTFSINDSKIGIVPIDKDSETLLSLLEHKSRYIPVIEKMTEKRKREWLTVRTLLKSLSGEEKEIAYQPNGKPYLTDHSCYISISHTSYRSVCDNNLSEYAAVILNEKTEVAIDIEMISPRILKVKDRFLSKEETLAISSDKEIVHLLLHWSAKETVLKMLDAENVEFRSQIHISPFEPVAGEWGSFEVCETRTGKRERFLIRYFVEENYVLTLCSK
ncbi:MAG: 4'-phosphopantetheinyl transferase superfamily protein [Dysgonamonadaceae bacterium]|jgi:4'-phosphopantetheinyl transferase EntD|nr:4'-phosphopantetheinyl transferase superfamily protein [Dysgonamonadaceae bacterium]